MKSKISIICIIIGAVVTLSFTVNSVNNQESRAKRDMQIVTKVANSPIGGIAIEDSF